MVHGGGWRIGSKTSRGVAANKAGRWIARGYIFASTDYRLLPDADPIDQARDAARALAEINRDLGESGPYTAAVDRFLARLGPKGRGGPRARRRDGFRASAPSDRRRSAP